MVRDGRTAHGKGAHRLPLLVREIVRILSHGAHGRPQFNTVDTPSTASDVRRTEKFHTLVVGASESMRCMCGRVVRASTMHMIEVLPLFKKTPVVRQLHTYKELITFSLVTGNATARLLHTGRLHCGGARGGPVARRLTKNDAVARGVIAACTNATVVGFLGKGWRTATSRRPTNRSTAQPVPARAARVRPDGVVGTQRIEVSREVVLSAIAMLFLVQLTYLLVPCGDGAMAFCKIGRVYGVEPTRLVAAFIVLQFAVLTLLIDGSNARARKRHPPDSPLPKFPPRTRPAGSAGTPARP